MSWRHHEFVEKTEAIVSHHVTNSYSWILSDDRRQRKAYRVASRHSSSFLADMTVHRRRIAAHIFLKLLWCAYRNSWISPQTKPAMHENFMTWKRVLHYSGPLWGESTAEGTGGFPLAVHSPLKGPAMWSLDVFFVVSTSELSVNWDVMALMYTGQPKLSEIWTFLI